MGGDRRCRVVGDVALPSAAVPRRGPGGLDRLAGRRAERLHLLVQLAHLRFPCGLDVCAWRRRRRRHAHEAACKRVGRAAMTTSGIKHEARSIGSARAAILAARHDSAAWVRIIDFLAVLVALLLPWSTSGVGIAVVMWLIVLVPTLDLKAFAQSLKRPICGLPIALFVLAGVGMLWSDAPWGARLYAVGPAAKLLMLPLLLYHFEKTSRGHWVFNAFLVSCAVMLVTSWITAFVPAFTFKPADDRVCGVFVKNYIDQGQEFALCVLALAFPVMTLWQEGKRRQAAMLMALAAAFIANMVFVIA